MEPCAMDKKLEDTMEDIYLKYIDNDDNIITVLQDIQNEFGYVPKDAVEWFAKKISTPVSKFYGVITFYSQFHLAPRGRNIVTVCCGTVCHVKGAPKVISKIKEDLKLKGEDQTTKDMLFTMEHVNCVGACSIAPVVIVNDKVFGKQSGDKMVKNLKPYKEEIRN
jgi:NADH:ubiquinone oxidoreductase subunit E